MTPPRGFFARFGRPFAKTFAMRFFRTGKNSRRFRLPHPPLAGDFAVATEIAPKDGMFRKGAEEHYFSVGRSALEAVRLAMLAAEKTSVDRILDLPCGHGRVLRALKAAFPRAQLTACDLNRAGVDFCVANFGATGDYSAPEPAQIALPGGYDLIWSGSLLTHLPEETCRGFLRLFRNLLAPGGIFIVTTHGRFVAERLRAGSHLYGLDAEDLPRVVESYEGAGFGYADYPKKPGYGISVNTPQWLINEITQLSEMRIALYAERLWVRHQDVIACTRAA